MKEHFIYQIVDMDYGEFGRRWYVSKQDSDKPTSDKELIAEFKNADDAVLFAKYKQQDHANFVAVANESLKRQSGTLKKLAEL
jgi:outer membrane protein assembly factor BamE (lipoprotein component of BamABCDE complex)